LIVAIHRLASSGDLSHKPADRNMKGEAAVKNFGSLMPLSSIARRITEGRQRLCCRNKAWMLV
jgi:hypothetical protein